MGLFKSSNKRQLNKFERAYWNESESMMGTWRDQTPEELGEPDLKRMHNTAFARAAHQLFGQEAVQHPPHLDPLNEDLWSRAQEKYLSGRRKGAKASPSLLRDLLLRTRLSGVIRHVFLEFGRFFCACVTQWKEGMVVALP